MRLPKRGLMIGSILILISGILPIGYAAWTQQVDVLVEHIPYKIAKLKISGCIKMSDILDTYSSDTFTLTRTTQCEPEDVTENQEEATTQEETTTQEEITTQEETTTQEEATTQEETRMQEENNTAS